MNDLSHLEIKNEVIQRAFQDALNARTNLTTYRHGDTDDNHVMKACTICDRHIPFDREQFVAIDDFKTKWNEFMYAKDKNVILTCRMKEIEGKLLGINRLGELQIQTKEKIVSLSDINYSMRLLS